MTLGPGPVESFIIKFTGECGNKITGKNAKILQGTSCWPVILTINIKDEQILLGQRPGQRWKQITYGCEALIVVGTKSQ